MTERIPALKKNKPKRPLRSKKLIRILVALFAVVLVVVFFRSPLAEVSKIEITGIQYLDEEEVEQALILTKGDSFFIPSTKVLKERVMSLKPVENVIINKKFPSKIRVEVIEYPQVAVQLTSEGQVLSVLSNGLSLPLPEGKFPDLPILSGWKPDDPNFASICLILSHLPSYLVADLSEIHPDPSTAYPNRIKLYTRSRFEVVTTVDKLPDRISYLSDIVQNREPGKITMLEADTYLPYSSENATEDDE